MRFRIFLATVLGYGVVMAKHSWPYRDVTALYRLTVSRYMPQSALMILNLVEVTEFSLESQSGVRSYR